MFHRSGFEKPSETPVPKPRRRRSSSMPPKLDEGQQAQAPAGTPPPSKTPMMFTGPQFERLLRSLDGPSQRAAVAAEAAQQAVTTMQRAFDLLRGEQPAQGAAAQRAPTGDRISKSCLLYTSPSPRDS